MNPQAAISPASAMEVLGGLRVRLAAAMRRGQDEAVLAALDDFARLDQSVYDAPPWQVGAGVVDDVKVLLLDHPASTLAVMEKCRYRCEYGEESPQRPLENNAIAIWLLLRTALGSRGRLRSDLHRSLQGLTHTEFLPHVPEPTDREVVTALIACRLGLSDHEMAAAMRGEVDTGALATLACLNDDDLGPWVAHLS